MHWFHGSNFIHRDVTFHYLLNAFYHYYTGTILPRECSDIADVKTGVYDIYPDGVLPAVMVYCVVNETKRWTVLFNLYSFEFIWTQGIGIQRLLVSVVSKNILIKTKIPSITCIILDLIWIINVWC